MKCQLRRLPGYLLLACAPMASAAPPQSLPDLAILDFTIEDQSYYVPRGASADDYLNDNETCCGIESKVAVLTVINNGHKTIKAVHWVIPVLRGRKPGTISFHSVCTRKTIKPSQSKQLRHLVAPGTGLIKQYGSQAKIRFANGKNRWIEAWLDRDALDSFVREIEYSDGTAWRSQLSPRMRP